MCPVTRTLCAYRGFLFSFIRSVGHRLSHTLYVIVFLFLLARLNPRKKNEPNTKLDYENFWKFWNTSRKKIRNSLWIRKIRNKIENSSEKKTDQTTTNQKEIDSASVCVVVKMRLCSLWLLLISIFVVTIDFLFLFNSFYLSLFVSRARQFDFGN